jgi:hypothetical protein
VDRQPYRVEHLWLQAQRVARQLYLGAELWSAEWCAHHQIGSPPVVAKIIDREGEPVDFNAIESLQNGERHLLIGCSEVEIGREAAGVSRSELSQCGTALENQTTVEQPALWSRCSAWSWPMSSRAASRPPFMP